MFGVVVWLVACGDPKPPTVCEEIPQQTVHVAQSVDLTPCFEDPENEKLTLTVESSNPESVAVSVSGAGIRVRGVSPGSAGITVTATDPDMLTADLIFQVVVPNRPPKPRGKMPAREVLVGGRTRWVASVYFEEPDGQELTYTAVSSDAGVAEASVVADTVVAVGRSLGDATITVTATDPGGLEAAQEALVAVVDPLRIFRDDFETDQSLDDWEDVSEGGARFWISDEKLLIENTDSFFPAFVGMELELEDWEVRASMANGTDRSWVQVGIGTGAEPVLAYLFQLGADPDTVFGAPETNYRLLVFDEDEWGILEGASGESDVVKDVNELMEMRFSVHGDTLSISVDGTELFNTHLGDNLPNSMEDMVLGVWAAGTTGKLGIFDWVEVLGPPRGVGSPRREYRRPAVLAPYSRNPSWQLPDIGAGPAVRIEDRRVVRSERGPGRRSGR